MKGLSIISLLLISLVAFSANNDVFDNANAAYKDGNFTLAADLYQSILEDGKSSDVYYNLANCYFKTGQFPKAILHYERALQLAPNDKEVLYNLKMANLQLKDKIQPKPAFFLLTWWKQFAQMQTANFWTVSFLIFLWSSIGLFLLFAFINHAFRNLFFYGGFISLLLTILLLFLSLTQHIAETKSNEAIIMSASIAVKSEPISSGKDLFIIHSGLKVKVIHSESDWLNIRLQDGKEGWVKEDALEMI